MKLWRDFTFEPEKIEELRAKVYEYARCHPDTIDWVDVCNRIEPPQGMSDVKFSLLDTNNNRKSDWMLKRFLVSAHQDVNEALQKFVEFFTFRNQFKISQMTLENVLPKEFFQIGPIENVGQDKQNNKNICVRLKYYKKLPQLDMITKRGLLYNFELLDLEYEQGLCDGVCFVIDCQEFSVANIDLDMLHFAVKQIPFSYAGLVRNVLIYELPYLLSYVVKVVETWLPSYVDKNGNKRKYFALVSKKTIGEYIDENQRPNYLNGTLRVDRTVPASVRPIAEVMPLNNVEEKNARKIDDYVKQLVKDLKS